MQWWTEATMNQILVATPKNKKWLKTLTTDIQISVKNSDNLDEFTTKTYIKPEYIPKL